MANLALLSFMEAPATAEKAAAGSASSMEGVGHTLKVEGMKNCSRPLLRLIYMANCGSQIASCIRDPSQSHLWRQKKGW